MEFKRAVVEMNHISDTLWCIIDLIRDTSDPDVKLELCGTLVALKGNYDQVIREVNK